METIRISKSREAVNWATRIFDSVFRFVGLRGKKKFWGVVYDAASKQPLDPAIVKLIDAEGNAEIQTCITDMKGRYGFLVQPGRYKILAKKTNYSFPSQKVTAGDDGDFKDIYHGEFFEVNGGSEVVAPNIPMDQVTADWNQQAKAKILKYRHGWLRLFSVLAAVAFWAAFSAALTALGLDFWRNLSITRSGWLWVFYAYVFTFILNGVVPQTRLWGEVLDKSTGRPLEGLWLELKNPVLPDLFMARTQTSAEGRFFLRVNPGSYVLEIRTADGTGRDLVLGRVKISVGLEALVNQTFWIDLQKGV